MESAHPAPREMPAVVAHRIPVIARLLVADFLVTPFPLLPSRLTAALSELPMGALRHPPLISGTAGTQEIVESKTQWYWPADCVDTACAEGHAAKRLSRSVITSCRQLGECAEAHSELQTCRPAWMAIGTGFRAS